MTILRIIEIFQVSANEGSGEVKHVSTLMNLPVELRMDIFEQLNFTELITLSRALPHDHYVIGRLFRNMMKNREFRILCDGYSREIRVFYGDFLLANIRYANVGEHFDEILDFLQSFGHCISKLKISYLSYVDKKLRESLHRRIRENVAGFVNEIEFNLDDKSVDSCLSDLTVPFASAKVVKLEKTEINATILHQMFPAVQHLDLGSIKMNESLSHFSNLERLTLPSGWGVKEFNLPLFRETLELNPQLKHLSIPECHRWDFLQTLNEIRPDIENLEISNFNYYDHENVIEPLRFAKMKVLKCISYNERREEDDNRIPLEFGNLEEIEFQGIHLTDYWINTTMQNEKIRKVTSLNVFRRGDVERIANALPNLEEVSMRYSAAEDRIVQEMVGLLQTAHQLKKVSFLYLNADQCNAAAQQLINEWQNELSNWHICCFVRK